LNRQNSILPTLRPAKVPTTKISSKKNQNSLYDIKILVFWRYFRPFLEYGVWPV